MTSVFDDIRLEWKGKPFTIPANRVMGAIARIEEVVTMQELAEYGRRGAAPMGRIASAYAAVLRYAGLTIEDSEVYLDLFEDSAVRARIEASVTGLLMMMIPPAVRKRMEAGLPPEKPVVAAGEEPLDPGKSSAPARGASRSTSRLPRAARRNGAHLPSSGS